MSLSILLAIKQEFAETNIWTYETTYIHNIEKMPKRAKMTKYFHFAYFFCTLSCATYIHVTDLTSTHMQFWCNLAASNVQLKVDQVVDFV